LGHCSNEKTLTVNKRTTANCPPGKVKTCPLPKVLGKIYILCPKVGYFSFQEDKLVGGLNSSEKCARQNGNLPQIGVNIKNSGNHDLEKISKKRVSASLAICLHSIVR